MDICDRTDIDGLLRGFFARTLVDPLLTHIIVDVAHMDLEEHLPTIGNFWQKVLFDTAVYNGCWAMEVHRRLHLREPLTAAHFERWLRLWDEAVEARHDGPLAEAAKAHAARIAVAIQRNLPAAGDAPAPATGAAPAAGAGSLPVCRLS